MLIHSKIMKMLTVALSVESGKKKKRKDIFKNRISFSNIQPRFFIEFSSCFFHRIRELFQQMTKKYADTIRIIIMIISSIDVEICNEH